VIDWALSPREIQAARIMVGIATAVFIGGRFLPTRYRQPVGIALTVCYLIGITAFLLYTMLW
jgi:hypothetical protein